MAFKMVYQQFLKRMRNPSAVSERVDRWVGEWQARYRADHGRELPPADIPRVRAIARQHIEADEEHFTQFRQNYFMIDLFPCKGGVNK